MKKLFTISDRFHGSGGVLFAWQPDGNFLATAGSNGMWVRACANVRVCVRFACGLAACLHLVLRWLTRLLLRLLC